MSTRRAYHTATVLSSGPDAGKILIAGGINNSANLASTELYDPGRNTFTPAAAMNSAHSYSAAVEVPAVEVIPTPTATPTATPTPPGPAQLMVAPPALKFGNAVYGNIGDASKPKKVTVSNPGGKNRMLAAFNGIALDGDFTVSENSCVGTLPPGQKCSLSVTFMPTAVGQRLGSIAIFDSAHNSPQEVSLSGTGIGGQLIIAPKSLSFTKQAAGTVSAPKYITLTNKNHVPLTISSIDVADSTNFTVSQTCVGTLVANGGSCKIAVQLTPASGGVPGKRTSQFTISDNAAKSHQVIQLSGTAGP